MIDVQISLGWLGIAFTALIALMWFLLPINDKLNQEEIKKQAWLHSLYGLISIQTLWIGLLVVAMVKGL